MTPPPSREALQGLEALRIAVEEALEKKRRLGQYAVVWVDGKPAYVGENAPEQPIAGLAEYIDSENQK